MIDRFLSSGTERSMLVLCLYQTIRNQRVDKSWDQTFRYEQNDISWRDNIQFANWIIFIWFYSL